MVFHVTGRKRSVVFAFKFSEQIFWQFAERIDQDAKTTTVGHANHRLLHTRRTCVLQQMIENRNDGVAALARETLLPHVLGVQVTL